MHFTKGKQFAYVFPEEFFCSDERKSATMNVRVYASAKTETELRGVPGVKGVKAVDYAAATFEEDGTLISKAIRGVEGVAPVAGVPMAVPVDLIRVEFHGKDYDKHVLPDNSDLDAIAAAAIAMVDHNNEKCMDGWVHNL